MRIFVVMILVVAVSMAMPVKPRLADVRPLSPEEVRALDASYDWNSPKFSAVRERLATELGSYPNCTLSWFTVPIDHFDQSAAELDVDTPETFQIRYYTCMNETWKAGDPIFFYTGNEAPIEEFMQWTGIMWQNARPINAKLVWAEHRYFGKSRPWMNESMPKGKKLRFLTPDQALADYADLINFLRYTDTPAAASSSIVGFGGSYGGLLCAWMKSKYPWALDGCLASSAPVGMFPGVHPPHDADHVAMIVTKDATAERGAAAGCSDNIRLAFKVIEQVGQTAEGLQSLSDTFNTCQPLSPSTGGAAVLMGWIESGLIAMAQSSFPYPNDLMLLGSPGMMPAYPLHAACNYLGGSFTSNSTLLERLASGMQVYFNASDQAQCNDVRLSYPPSKNAATLIYLWEYIACTTVMLEYGSNGVTDMFFKAPYNQAAQVAACKSMYGPELRPVPEYPQLRFGGRSVGATNIRTIFSSGGYDPIRAGSIVNATNLNPQNDAVVIPAYGHTGDLAFSNANDSAAMKSAREFIVATIYGWTKADQKRLEKLTNLLDKQ